MFAIFFLILVLIAILSIVSNFVIRFRLTFREPSSDKLVWWRQGSDEVTSMYAEVFPKSYLPLFSRFAFLLVLTVAVVVLGAYFWKS
jgi:hypothetical protein